MNLISKQPGSHKYKVALDERIDIPSVLDRAFGATKANQVRCGDITYIWAGSRWVYLGVSIDLFNRRVVGWAMSRHPDATLAINTLDHAYQLRGEPQGLLFQSDQGKLVHKPAIPPSFVALSHQTGHEPTWKLLGGPAPRSTLGIMCQCSVCLEA